MVWYFIGVYLSLCGHVISSLYQACKKLLKPATNLKNWWRSVKWVVNEKPLLLKKFARLTIVGWIIECIIQTIFSTLRHNQLYSISCLLKSKD